jgi:putative acetyltransferase
MRAAVMAVSRVAPGAIVSLGCGHAATPNHPERRASMELHIVTVDPQGEDALALLREAAIDVRALYPEVFAPDAPPPTNPPLPERGVYLVAYAGGVPVGCGALRPLDEAVAEVRRMYVHREHRRRGTARALLEELVREAKHLGYHALRLETGNRQGAAMALYEAYGFRRIPPWGEYAADPTSVCYELRLRADQNSTA